MTTHTRTRTHTQQCLWRYHYDKVIMGVHPVHPMNAEQCLGSRQPTGAVSPSVACYHLYPPSSFVKTIKGNSWQVENFFVIFIILHLHKFVVVL